KYSIQLSYSRLSNIVTHKLYFAKSDISIIFVCPASQEAAQTILRIVFMLCCISFTRHAPQKKQHYRETRRACPVPPGECSNAKFRRRLGCP
ncbi:MAG: hypothetical protein ABW202_02590, partial [Duganella sp.]